MPDGGDAVGGRRGHGPRAPAALPAQVTAVGMPDVIRRGGALELAAWHGDESILGRLVLGPEQVPGSREPGAQTVSG